MAERLLTTRQTAELLNVGPTSVKRWADDGRLPCVRTAGGHRRFELEAIRAFSRSLEGGHTEADAFIDLLAGREPAMTVQVGVLDLRARLGSWAAAASVLGEVLVRMGERWRDGQLTIPQEHHATERLSRALNALADQIPVASDAPTVVLMVAGDDAHTVGLALVEIVARATGWSTFWVGTRAQMDVVEEVLDEVRPRMVCASASTWSGDELALARAAERLGTSCHQRNVGLAFGGNGAWPERPAYGQRLRSFSDLTDMLAVYASGPPSVRAVSGLSSTDGE